jgi:proline racemase
MTFLAKTASVFEHTPSFVTTIDSHTEGEATRLIVDGPGEILGSTMMEKLAYYKANYDQVRCLVTQEPRGSRDILAAQVTGAVSPNAAFGLIYMDAKRYPYLCGHATIGAVVTLARTGTLDLGEGENKVLVDTPSGIMDARARVEKGQVVSVAINMVPSFVQDTDLFIEVPGFGRVCLDLVCTGGYFAMVDADRLGIAPKMENREQLIDLGMKIIDAANAQLEVSHPEQPDVNTVDVTEFYTSDHTGDAPRGRGVVVYGESHMDRSPCGTGTASKLALLHHRGHLAMHQPYCNQSPLDTVFEAELVDRTTIGSYAAYVTQIRGRAWITGGHQFIIEETDPFQNGYLI